MGVDMSATLNTNIDAPPRRVSPANKEAHLDAIFATLDADDEQDAAEVPARPEACRASVSRPAEQRGGWPLDELENWRKLAEEGDPASARRVAELLELRHDEVGAAAWWHRAAALGDEDAILYVKEVYST